MDIFVLLVQDGLTNGAIYALVALALVLVFTVTRIIMVQAGEFVAYGALTLTAIQAGTMPMITWVMLGASVVAALPALVRARTARGRLDALARPILAPALIALLTVVLVPRHPPLIVQVALALAIVTPLGSAMYRLAYAPIARASILVLLIASVALHFVLSGLGLLLFGPEGARTEPFTRGLVDLGPAQFPAQSLWIFGTSAVLVVALYAFFTHSMVGTSLRAAASNPRGAMLMGISPDRAGERIFTMAVFLCAISGILISPIITVSYDSGFLIALKAFVGAVIGAMVSYPLAAGGAVLIGLGEAFAAFEASSYKEVIVFAAMVPILLIRSLSSKWRIDDDDADPADVRQAPSSRWLRAVARSLQQLPRAAIWAIAALIMMALPFMVSDAEITGIDEVLLYSIVTLGVVLLTGVAGQVSFGQAAFVGFGAYSVAVLSSSCSSWSWLGPVAAGSACAVPAWASLLVALAVTGIAAFVLGKITLRMREHYLPIATIAWGISIYFLFGNLPGLGGFSGISDLPQLQLPYPLNGILGGLSYEARLYFLILVFAVAGAVAVANLLDSRSGRAIRALRSRSLMAESQGVDTAALRVNVFIVAALFAALSGWLYAQLQSFVDPSPFSLTAGVEFVFMAVVGGSGHVLGAFLGAEAVRLVEDLLQDVFSTDGLGGISSLQNVLFGVIILLLLRYMPNGIAGTLAAWFPRRKTGERQAGRQPPLQRVRDQSEPLELRVSNLSKRFAALVAVDRIDFQLGAGEIVALIGPNGAGKSTLFNLITGMMPATDGGVFLGSHRLDVLSAHAIARLGVARSFQHFKLLADRSVLENVAIGTYTRTRSGMLRSMLRLDRNEEAAALAEARLQIERLGLAEYADTPAGELPLGKQRMVEVARALAASPVMILLDEPAAGLRYREKQDLAAVLRHLRADGIGILLVEHDMAFVMDLADRIVVMNFGRKIADGTAAEVRCDPAVLDAYLGAGHAK